ncbi:MAG: hypothetical protein ACFCU3_02765 [Verrucomicrobiales bacterium]
MNSTLEDKMGKLADLWQVGLVKIQEATTQLQDVAKQSAGQMKRSLEQAEKSEAWNQSKKIAQDATDQVRDALEKREVRIALAITLAVGVALGTAIVGFNHFRSRQDSSVE